MTDTLSDVLAVTRLKGTVYFSAELRAPWGGALPPRSRSPFYMVTRGRCEIMLDGAAPSVSLGSGDLVVLPGGSAHALASGARVSTPSLEQFVAASDGRARAPEGAGWRGSDDIPDRWLLPARASPGAGVDARRACFPRGDVPYRLRSAVPRTRGPKSRQLSGDVADAEGSLPAGDGYAVDDADRRACRLCVGSSLCQGVSPPHGHAARRPCAAT